MHIFIPNQCGNKVIMKKPTNMHENTQKIVHNQQQIPIQNARKQKAKHMEH